MPCIIQVYFYWHCVVWKYKVIKLCTWFYSANFPRSHLIMSIETTPGPSGAAEVEIQIANELAAQAEILPDKPTKYMTELIGKPRIRGVFLRHGKFLQFSRSTNKDAILAFTRGEVAESPCTSCDGGAGPFTLCVTVTDMLKGSCSNCYYGSEGARCSFRPGRYLFTQVNLC